MSDGLLRLLAVATIQELPEPPRMVLFDEVENGVHPHLLGGLIGLLEELVVRSDGATQVIATTHSPVALGHVTDPAAVLIVDRAPDGFARATSLAETEPYRRIGGGLDLGELWYNLGEERLVPAT